MITIQYHFAVSNVRHGEQTHFCIRHIIRRAFELHANLKLCRKQSARLDFDQVGVVLTKTIRRLDLHGVLLANCLAFQRFFNLRQRVVIAAVQVNHRLTALFDQVTLRIGQLVVQRNDRILRNVHAHPLSKPARIIRGRSGARPDHA